MTFFLSRILVSKHQVIWLLFVHLQHTLYIYSFIHLTIQIFCSWNGDIGCCFRPLTNIFVWAWFIICFQTTTFCILCLKWLTNPFESAQIQGLSSLPLYLIRLQKSSVSVLFLIGSFKRKLGARNGKQGERKGSWLIYSNIWEHEAVLFWQNKILHSLKKNNIIPCWSLNENMSSCNLLYCWLHKCSKSSYCVRTL